MQNEPLLGLATTEEMLEEISTRFSMHKYDNFDPVIDHNFIDKLRKDIDCMIALFPKEILKYRTVDER
jgi:hypothetical protein